MPQRVPFIDDLVAVNDLLSLYHLGELLAEMAEHRSRRPDRNGKPRVHRAAAFDPVPRPGVVA